MGMGIHYVCEEGTGRRCTAEESVRGEVGRIRRAGALLVCSWVALVHGPTGGTNLCGCSDLSSFPDLILKPSIMFGFIFV